MEEKIKVLIVDDANVMRKAVADILTSDPMIEIVGTAENGLIGLQKAQNLEPDVITLDMDMPVMNGISAIRHIMIKCQIPVVALSSLFADGSVTFEALRLGVVDFVPKPSGAVSRDIESDKEKIIDRVKLAAAVKVSNIHRARLHNRNSGNGDRNLRDTSPLESLIIVGTNLCGPNTIIQMMANLDPDLPTSVIAIQEISPSILPTFAQQFDRHVPWTIKSVQEDTIIETGTCYLGSNETSLSLTTTSEGETQILVGEAVDRPIDLLYSTAAEAFHGSIVGVLLGGIGDDGAEGLGRIQQHGGTSLVKDTHYCVFPNLTENAIRSGVVDQLVSDGELPAAIQSALP
jgi:two-component system chemotaxis response regulator CheB